MTYTNLQDLTSQESGIIIFADNNIIVCNWSHMQGIPRVLVPIGLIGLPQDIVCNTVNVIDSVSNFFGDGTTYTVQHDDTPNGITTELAANDPAAKVYCITAGPDEIIVIAPDGWA